MAARDRFTISLKCPKCGRTGEAQVSEDDYPFMRSPRFSVDSLPDGFEVKKHAATRVETEIICSTCKVLVK
jgi:hypothetical protein